MVSATAIQAATISFQDNNKYWGDNTTWTASQKWATDTPNYGYNGNTTDVIGDPNITGGQVTLSSSGRLQSVNFNYYTPQNTWTMLAPGSLFINVLNGANDTTWDYVVNTMGNPLLGTQNGAQVLGSSSYTVSRITALNISAQNNGYTGAGTYNGPYVLSGKDMTGIWAGYVIRDNHPIGIRDTLLADTRVTSAGSALFSGFPNVSGVNAQGLMQGSASYDFGATGLDLFGKDFVLAWGTTCANDVVYETIHNPVPEPGTLLLLGCGLLAVAGFRRSRQPR
jgi:hypothetical protein